MPKMDFLPMMKIPFSRKERPEDTPGRSEGLIAVS